jgi:endogenous inhibitor of DNA gyrase (YacG/DUF329 family)
MEITKITWRHRNDFRFVAHCDHCGKDSAWPDGYADGYYQLVVFPNRPCPHCDVSEVGFYEIRCASLPGAPPMEGGRSCR